jgi:hypothetical protein
MSSIPREFNRIDTCTQPSTRTWVQHYDRDCQRSNRARETTTSTRLRNKSAPKISQIMNSVTLILREKHTPKKKKARCELCHHADLCPPETIRYVDSSIVYFSQVKIKFRGRFYFFLVHMCTYALHVIQMRSYMHTWYLWSPALIHAHVILMIACAHTCTHDTHDLLRSYMHTWYLWSPALIHAHMILMIACAHTCTHDTYDRLRHQGWMTGQAVFGELEGGHMFEVGVSCLSFLICVFK